MIEGLQNRNISSEVSKNHNWINTVHLDQQPYSNIHNLAQNANIINVRLLKNHNLEDREEFLCINLPLVGIPFLQKLPYLNMLHIDQSIFWGRGPRPKGGGEPFGHKTPNFWDIKLQIFDAEGAEN